jgi:hypothetical protein
MLVDILSDSRGGSGDNAGSGSGGVEFMLRSRRPRLHVMIGMHILGTGFIVADSEPDRYRPPDRRSLAFVIAC